MSFLYASFLWLLIPLFAYLYRRKERQHFSQNLRWDVLVLLIVALARPVLSENMSQEKVNAHSLVIALDLSVSMNANDIQPSRLLVARESIKAFLERDSQEQVALVGFTSNPLLLSPPTTDHNLVQLALENMKSEYILTKGTNLQKLFEKIAQFKSDEKKVILFTDGGDKVLDEALIALIQREKIKILAIGMGTHQGATILQKDGTLLQDKENKIVVSRLNGALKLLAEQSGGMFIAFSSVKNTVETIESWLKSQKLDLEGLEKETKEYFELAFVPLVLALILFFFSATRFSKKLLALLLLLGLNLQAEELLTREQWGEGIKKIEVQQSSWGLLDPYYLQRAYAKYEDEAYGESQKYVYKMKHRSLEAQLLLAHTFYRQENYKATKSVLQVIKSSSAKVKQQVYYELGNCEAKLLYWTKAKNYYVKALQLGEEKDALHNLEVVLCRLGDNAFKVGYTNPSSAQQSNAKNEDVENEASKESSQKSESMGASGGTGDKKSKNSTVKVVASNDEGDAKRTFSSKAYDLINEGYIKENRPW